MGTRTTTITTITTIIDRRGGMNVHNRN